MPEFKAAGIYKFYLYSDRKEITYEQIKREKNKEVQEKAHLAFDSGTDLDPSYIHSGYGIGV